MTTTNLALCRECGAQRPHHQCETGEPGCLHCDECGTMLHPDGPPPAVVDARPSEVYDDFWCRTCQELTEHEETGDPCWFACGQCDRRLEHCDDCGSSPCVRHDETPRIRAAFGVAGFCVIDTGGGAQAFARIDGDRQTLVTVHDDAQLPTAFDQPVFAGIYVASDPAESWSYDNQVDCDDYESVTSYLARWL